MLFFSIGTMTASTSSSTWSTTASTPGTAVNYITTPGNTYTYSITPYTPTDTSGKTIKFLNGVQTSLDVIDICAKNFEVISSFIQATGASFGILKVFKATFEQQMAKFGNSPQETSNKVKQFLNDVDVSIGTMLNMIFILPDKKASLADAYQNLANAYRTNIGKEPPDAAEDPLSLKEVDSKTLTDFDYQAKLHSTIDPSEEEAIQMFEAAASYEPPPGLEGWRNSGSTKPTCGCGG